jgi:hypothetical protein
MENKIKQRKRCFHISILCVVLISFFLGCSGSNDPVQSNLPVEPANDSDLVHLGVLNIPSGTQVNIAYITTAILGLSNPVEAIKEVLKEEAKKYLEDAIGEEAAEGIIEISDAIEVIAALGTTNDVETAKTSCKPPYILAASNEDICSYTYEDKYYEAGQLAITFILITDENDIVIGLSTLWAVNPIVGPIFSLGEEHMGAQNPLVDDNFKHTSSGNYNYYLNAQIDNTFTIDQPTVTIAGTSKQFTGIYADEPSTENSSPVVTYVNIHRQTTTPITIESMTFNEAESSSNCLNAGYDEIYNNCTTENPTTTCAIGVSFSADNNISSDDAYCYYDAVFSNGTQTTTAPALAVIGGIPIPQ